MSDLPDLVPRNFEGEAWLRAYVVHEHLEKLNQQIAELEKRVEALETDLWKPR